MTNTARLHASAEDLSKDYLTPRKSNIQSIFEYQSAFFQHVHSLTPNPY
jgi:hypothetical protein